MESKCIQMEVNFGLRTESSDQMRKRMSSNELGERWIWLFTDLRERSHANDMKCQKWALA